MVDSAVFRQHCLSPSQGVAGIVSPRHVKTLPGNRPSGPKAAGQERSTGSGPISSHVLNRTFEASAALTTGCPASLNRRKKSSARSRFGYVAPPSASTETATPSTSGSFAKWALAHGRQLSYYPPGKDKKIARPLGDKLRSAWMPPSTSTSFVTRSRNLTTTSLWPPLYCVPAQADWEWIRARAKQVDLGVRFDAALEYRGRPPMSPPSRTGRCNPKEIAVELTQNLRKSVMVWANRETVGAKLGATVNTLPRRYTYPPHRRQGANDLVLPQAESLSAEWVEAA